MSDDGNCCCDGCCVWYDKFYRSATSVCADGVNYVVGDDECSNRYKFDSGDWTIERVPSGTGAKRLLCVTGGSTITLYDADSGPAGPYSINFSDIHPNYGIRFADGDLLGQWFEYLFGSDTTIRGEWTAEDEMTVTITTPIQTNSRVIGGADRGMNFMGMVALRNTVHQIFDNMCLGEDGSPYDIMEVHTVNGSGCVQTPVDASGGWSSFGLRASEGVSFRGLCISKSEPACVGGVEGGCCFLCFPDETDTENHWYLPTTATVSVSNLVPGKRMCDEGTYNDCYDLALAARTTCFGTGSCPTATGCRDVYCDCRAAITEPMFIGLDINPLWVAAELACQHEEGECGCECYTVFYEALVNCLQSGYPCSDRITPVQDLNAEWVLDLVECAKCNPNDPCIYTLDFTIEEIQLTGDGVLCGEFASEDYQWVASLYGSEGSSFYVEVGTNALKRMYYDPDTGFPLTDIDGDPSPIDPFVLVTEVSECEKWCSATEALDLNLSGGGMLYADEMMFMYPLVSGGRWVNEPSFAQAITGVVWDDTEKTCTSDGYTTVIDCERPAHDPLFPWSITSGGT